MIFLQLVSLKAMTFLQLISLKAMIFLQFKEFALAHKEQLMPYSQTVQRIIDTASLRINWIKKYASGINNWFENYVHSKFIQINTFYPEYTLSIKVWI